MTPKMQPFWWFLPPVITCPSGEQVTNGGFELGNFTGWTQSGSQIVTDKKRSGIYSAKLWSSWVRQDFSPPIPKECIESFGFYTTYDYWYPTPDYVELHFSDETYITIYFPRGGGWNYCNLLPWVPDGKSVSYFKIVSVDSPFWLDDASLIGTG